jgi:hypothetical protein
VRYLTHIMAHQAKEPESLQEAIRYFANPDNCLNYIVARRWRDGVVCPNCGSKEVSFILTRRLWECKAKHEKRQFSAKVGTVMEDSAIGLDKWLCAFWMVANCRNGVSSYEIHRTVKVTQKSAWFMLHRIRLAMQECSTTKLGGSGNPIEIDETFIGGKSRNMHKGRKLRFAQARSNVRDSEATQSARYWGKTVVMGMLERGGNVKASVIPERKGRILRQIVRESVALGCEIMTDEFNGYIGLSEQYVHQIINHLDGYVREHVSTNGIENFWSLLKRGLNGTYVAVEPFHLFRYVDEQAFRFNNRRDALGNKMSDAQRFDAAVSQIVNKRLTYAELTGKVGETIN